MWLIWHVAGYSRRLLKTKNKKSEVKCLVTSDSRNNFSKLCPVERRERVLGFICQLFGRMGGCFLCGGAGGVTEAHPSPLAPLSLPLPSPPPAPLAALRPLLLWLPSGEQQSAVGVLRCEGRSSLSAVEGKRTEKAELRISAAELRSHRDKVAGEENLQRRCVKTHVKSYPRLQFNQEGTLSYGGTFYHQSLSLSISFSRHIGSFSTLSQRERTDFYSRKIHFLAPCLVFFLYVDLVFWAAGCSGLCPGNHSSFLRSPGEPGSCRSCSRGLFLMDL